MKQGLGMRLSARIRLRSIRPLCLLLLPLLLLPAGGCRGRAEYFRGQELYRAGDYRGAYYHFWEAYREGPSASRLGSLELAGRRVAAAERERGVEAEIRGDPEGAIESYALALEYDPRSAATVEDYGRVWQRIESLARLEERLETLRASRSEDAAAMAIETLRAVALHPGFSLGRAEGLRAELLRAGEKLVGPLRDRARKEALFPGPAGIQETDEMEASCLRALASLEAAVLDEARDLVENDPRAREVASWGLFRESLSDFIEEARGGLRVAEEAAAGLRLLEAGREREARGDLAGAIEAYQAAILRHPAAEGAHDGRSRARRRLSTESYQAALLAFRGKEWRKANDILEVIVRHVPDHPEAADLLIAARRELSAAHAREGRRFEEDGLPLNALVAYHQALSSRPDGEDLREAIRRLEGSLQARLHPRFRMELRAIGADERRARRDLWGVGEEALSRLERALGEAVRSRLALESEAAPRDSARAAAAGVRVGVGAAWKTLLIEDLDFSCPRGDRTFGVETSRYVESVRLVENPDLAEARGRAEAAREGLERAISHERDAPRRKSRFAAERTALAGLRAEQARARISALPLRVPDIAWSTVSYPTARIRLRIELACRYRLDSESRWASAAIDIEDRVVEGDPQRSVPADPEELISRSEALRILGPKVGEALAEDALEALRGLHERFYRDALARIADRSFYIAVEDLVAFLYSRRGADDPLAADASSRLRDLTGCDLPALWKALREPRGAP